MKNDNADKSGVFRIAAFSALIWIALFLFSAWAHNYDLTYFIHAGDKFADAENLPENFNIVPKAGGYDGQFYYRLAKDPFTSVKTDFGITLDDPPLRHQRILYPLLVWILSLGGRFFVPELLMLVNVACLVFLGWMGARIAAATGREPAVGLLFSLFPGFLLSLRSDLTEPLAAAMLAAYLYLYLKGRPAAANLALALAILARESMLIVAIGKTAELLLLCLLKKDERGEKFKEFLLSLLPFAPFALLQAALFFTWGEIPLFESGARNVVAPFRGFLRYMNWMLFHARDVRTIADFIEPAGVLIFMAAGLWTVIKDRFSRPSHAFWLLAYGVLLFSLNTAWNPTFLRVFTDPVLLCSFIILSRRRPGALEKALLVFTFAWFMLEAYEIVKLDYFLRTSYAGWR